VLGRIIQQIYWATQSQKFDYRVKGA